MTLDKHAAEIINIFVDESDQHIFAEVITILRAVEAETIELAAKVAEGLNGWGSNPCPELADHIAKTIRALQDEQGSR